jgi:hypothetical protein
LQGVNKLGERQFRRVALVEVSYEPSVPLPIELSLSIGFGFFLPSS